MVFTACEGGTLVAKVVKGGVLAPPSRLKRFAAQVAPGLARWQYYSFIYMACACSGVASVCPALGWLDLPERH